MFRQVLERLGGRMRYVVSGGAALSTEIGRLFFGFGLPILEGYGLTETSPVLCVMPFGRVRFGTVGRPLPNVELRIADDGEILARGPSIFGGYYRRPEDTAEALRDGWFHTGDIGTIDADGFVRITDRKKALIVTSGGKKIATQAIEAALKDDPLVAEAVVIGHGRHFPAVLIVPAFAELAARFDVPPPATDDACLALAARQDVRALYDGIVERVNAGLAQFERLKKVALVPRELTIDRGEVTPTLKVKRRVVEETCRDLIDGLYAP